jgi:Lon protease-like protein
MHRLPLFVLPTVLFPGSLLPLHVFEPRYRRMAARCLEMDRRFGVLYHDPSRSGEFVLREGGIGCEAEILQFQPLQDGRSLLLTRGLGRFRVSDGVESETSYEEAVVEEYEDEGREGEEQGSDGVEPGPDGEDGEDGEDLVGRRRASIELYGAVLRRRGTPAPASAIDDRRDVSFQIAQTFQIDAAWQQLLLELRSEALRLDEIDRVLRSFEAGR